MSDKLSSPSASSGNSSGKSPLSRSSITGNGDDAHLVVTRPAPKYVYSNESFDVEVQLELSKTANPGFLDRFDIELVASLHYCKTGRECGSDALLITEPSTIILSHAGDDSKRSCRVTCMIRMDAIRRDQGASLEVRFSPRPDASPPVRNIAGAATGAINLVNYKIRLTLDEEWGHVWYKDEGGRDKSMEVYAAIYDKDGQLRTGEQIPLLPILCYENEGNNPLRVSNQELLRTLGTTNIVIDKDTGKARLRFRVEDVSKNHQGQDFVLEVGPDPKAKGFKDVAPAFTPPVNVRSKRNKRSRTTSSNRSSEGRRASPVAGSRARPSYDDQQDINFDSADISRLRDAMKGVINWADEVVNGLFPLQWQVLGYAQHPDGSPDYSRPYHNMPNPNPCISRILSMYSDSVRESLRILSNAVEQASPRSDEMYMPMAASLPIEPEVNYGMMRSQPPGGHMHGMPPPGMGRRPGPGMHPGVAQEAFRNKPPEAPMPYQARASLPQMHQHPSAQYMRPPRMEETDMMHPQMSYGRPLPPDMPMQRSIRNEEESRESEVEYVLAKQYKALRTGERLGFPAYSINKEILGFYREPSSNVGVGQFTPISRHRNDFGPLEIMQATKILEDAIAKKSEAVHALRDWGNIANLLDHALVYDWSKDIGNDPGGPNAGD